MAQVTHHVRLVTLFCAGLALTAPAFSTTYSNAEQDITGWSVRDSTPAGARISVVTDNKLQSRVIQTRGAGRLNSYILGGTSPQTGWNNTDETFLSWKMSSSEPYTVIVHIETDDGIRRLTYNQSNSDLLANPNNNTIHFGLGSETQDGNWREQKRDLAADVRRGEPGILLKAVNGFELFGSFRVDDVALEIDRYIAPQPLTPTPPSDPVTTLPPTPAPDTEEVATTIYSDERSGTRGWQVFDNFPRGASLSVVFDSQLQQQVIQTQGSGLENRYLLGNIDSRRGWNNSQAAVLNWKMASSEVYSIQMFVQTSRGIRRLEYAPVDTDTPKSNRGNAITFGLGSNTRDGEWREFARNLADDVAAGEPGNQLLAINGMMILGDTRVSAVSLSSVVDEPATPVVVIPPQASIRASATSGAAPLTVTFDANGSTAAEQAVVESFDWNFGNGDVADSAVANSTFTQAGSYTVALSVKDSNGLSDSTSVNINVNSANSDSCDGYITNAESFVVPRISKPQYLRTYKDPVFGAPVTRITNSTFSEVRKPPYSTMQAWNADESLLLIYKSSGSGGGTGHFLLDGHTYKPVRQLPISPSDLEEVFWSHKNPDELFYVSRASSDFGKFNRYSVTANRSFEVADFSGLCQRGLPQSGDDVHMQSLDDDLFGFRCKRDDGSSRMFSYRVSTDKVTSARIGSGTPWADRIAPVPAPSGKRFWYQGTALATNLTTVQRRMDLGKSNEHSSVGRTHDGQDAMYQVAFGSSPNGCNGDAYRGVGHLIEHNLETGECRSIISQAQGFPYTTSSTHMSALATAQPNLVAMSSIGNSGQTDLLKGNTAAPPLFSEIYLADTDPDNAVTCRLAHHRSFGKSAKRGGYPAYFGEPHATISPSGTRIIFGSDWYDSGSVDSYVVALPGYKAPVR